MHLIKNTFFEGERACFAANHTRFENVKFYPGESAIKHSHHVEAYRCQFMGKYPFWHNHDVVIDDCLFTVYGRTAIWYSQNVRISNCQVDAPKMFREVDNLVAENLKMPNAEETGWNCRDVVLRNIEAANGDYFFMNGRNIEVENLRLQGNYSFQDAKNVVVRNSHLNSKDAFWGSENVTVYDSVIDGEYLGWHSKNLRLVNCTLRGTQALCYCTNLVLENCIMEETDLAFEYSTLTADVKGHIDSVKNPQGGRINAGSIGEIILDAHCVNPGACLITAENTASA